jgi:hypothetical protein
MGAVHFKIEGLKELEAEMRAVDRKLTREITRAARLGGAAAVSEAKNLVPKDTGKMAGLMRPRSGPLFFGVANSHPGAGVQNYATDYLRKTPGTAGSVTRSVKRFHRHTGYHDSSATQEVHMVNVSAKGPSGDRFMSKALDNVGDKIAEEIVWPAITDVLQANGWWD